MPNFKDFLIEIFVPEKILKVDFVAHLFIRAEDGMGSFLVYDMVHDVLTSQKTTDMNEKKKSTNSNGGGGSKGSTSNNTKEGKGLTGGGKSSSAGGGKSPSVGGGKGSSGAGGGGLFLIF